MHHTCKNEHLYSAIIIDNNICFIKYIFRIHIKLLFAQIKSG